MFVFGFVAVCAVSLAVFWSPNRRFATTSAASDQFKFGWDYAKCASLSLISSDSYLAHTNTWQFSPRPHHQRCLDDEDRRLVGQRIASALMASCKPIAVFVERSYLADFVEAVGTAATDNFVLVVVETRDAPLTRELQGKISSLRGLRACFATNLHAPLNASVFHPLPLGFGPRKLRKSEALILDTGRSAKPWSHRDPRLLLSPMAPRGRLRKQYRRLLGGEAYRNLVRIVEDPLAFDDFLKLLSEHRCVLSPRGKGYDCFRTWEALAVGSVPLVVNDTRFDQRLHSHGSQYIPLPNELSPTTLDHLLARLEDPGEYAERLKIQYWKTTWDSYLE